MPADGHMPSAVDESTADTPKMGDTLSQSKSRDLRLIAQRAVVQALRSCVNAAIADRDEVEAQAAHDDLIRAELRLHRMEGFALADPDGGEAD